MNIQHYWNFFLKRTLRKKSVWIPLVINVLIFLGFFFFLPPVEGSTNIESVSDFSRRSFQLQRIFLLKWFYLPNLMAWVLWWRCDDIGQETQKDGTDLFLLSTEIPTNRKQIFLGKVFFVTVFLTSVHLIFVALPELILIWKQGAFSGYTGINVFLVVVGNFLLAPLLFFLPLFIFLFSLASLKSIWYTILKWSGIFVILLLPIIIQIVLLLGEERLTGWREKVQSYQLKLDNNYHWIILAIVGITILFSLITLRLACEDYQKKDLS